MTEIAVEPAGRSPQMKAFLFGIRYGLPLLLVIGAVVMYAVAPTSSIALEGLAMGLGAAISLLLLNVIWRFGFSGDQEREAEEAARRYLTEHGRWPDEDDD